MSNPLSSADKKRLRGQAMALKPVVSIGKDGLNDPVIKATDDSLTRHKLIKVRILSDDRQKRNDLITTLADKTGATLCGMVGKNASLFREVS